MTIWILDTDHVSHLLQGNKVVSSRVNRVLPNLAITVVTVQEIFNGWIVKINSASESTDLARLYTKLWNKFLAVGAKKPGFFSQTFGENKISLRNPVSYSMEVRSRF